MHITRSPLGPIDAGEYVICIEICSLFWTNANSCFGELPIPVLESCQFPFWRATNSRFGEPPIRILESSQLLFWRATNSCYGEPPIPVMDSRQFPFCRAMHAQNLSWTWVIVIFTQRSSDIFRLAWRKMPQAFGLYSKQCPLM